jgi:hypothetical protein
MRDSEHLPITFSGGETMATETAPSWLSTIIERVWHDYLLHFRRVNQITKAIMESAQGKGVKDVDKVKDAVRAGMHAAEESEHLHKEHPNVDSASPSHVAAEVIAKRLGLSLS